MTARYWLVGDAPSREALATPESWLTPDGTGIPNPANRLLELTGWTLARFLVTFRPRTHLWANPNRVWVAEGRAQAARIAERSLEDGSAGVIVLGALAARMFDLEVEEAMEWRGRFAFVPHPARQSHYWTAERREQARAFFASLLRTGTPSRKTAGSDSRGD